MKCCASAGLYNPQSMIRQQLARQVAQAIEKAQAAGDLPRFELPAFTIDHPRQAQMADYAASVAMQLARSAKLPPQQIAQQIAKHLVLDDTASVEVTGPYINFRLNNGFLTAQVPEILKAGNRWGDI